jgi:hypothetical protein
MLSENFIVRLAEDRTSGEVLACGRPSRPSSLDIVHEKLRKSLSSI